ncbi:MAG TPA: protoporphyrinogen oxidase [Vampirovibrionales bacterium]
MTESTQEVDLLIVGGGIAGLSAAHTALQDAQDFLLIEASDRLGGCIKTSNTEKVYELGPQTFALGNYSQQLITELNLEPTRPIKTAKNKHVFSEGKLFNISNPFEFFFSNFLSLQAKLSFLKELFISKSKEAQIKDESLSDFFDRHFCPEVAEKMIWPLIGGIYAGNPNQLSISAVFPKLKTLAQQNGSIVKGLIQQVLFSKSKSKFKRDVISFKGGIYSLVGAIKNELPENQTSLNTSLLSLEENSNGYLCKTNTGNIKCKRLILATPAYVSAKVAPQYFQTLQQINYAPIVTCNLSFKADSISKNSLSKLKSSFGFLVAKNANLQILGAVFYSSLFPSKSNNGTEALTVFLGGSNNPEMLNKTNAEITEICKSELSKAFQEEINIQVLEITHWDKAVPQYKEEHLELIKDLEKEQPKSIALAGNYLKGVSIEDTIKSGVQAYKATSNE